MLTLWQKAPDFELLSTTGKVRLSDFQGKWLVLFFYTKDFTAVCNSELAALINCYDDFRRLNAAVLGISTDEIESHSKCAKELKLRFPLASDAQKNASKAYGVLNEQVGLDFRGTFIIDPQGIVKYMVVSDLGIGRSVKEILRVLKALQTGEMTPAEWKGGKTLGKQ